MELIKNGLLLLKNKIHFKIILVILIITILETNGVKLVLGNDLIGLDNSFLLEDGLVVAELDNQIPNINEAAITIDETAPYPFHSVVTLGLIKGYQKFISTSKVIDCPMYPSCSHFGYQAFQTENPFEAFALTGDRLHRCGHDLNNYEVVKVGENYRLYDPPGYLPALKGIGERDTPDNTKQIIIQPEVKNNDLLSKDEQQYQFAKSIELSGDYGRAIVEYRRLIFYYPNSQYKSQAMEAILDCYYKAKKYDEAARWGIYILENGLNENDKNSVRFKIGCAYLRLKNNLLAREFINQVITTENGILQEKKIGRAHV